MPCRPSSSCLSYTLRHLKQRNFRLGDLSGHLILWARSFFSLVSYVFSWLSSGVVLNTCGGTGVSFSSSSYLGYVYPITKIDAVELTTLINQVLLIAFIIDQLFMDENATIPPRIAKQRTVAGVSWFILCIFGAFTTNIYFIPIYFQAIKGSTAEGSGIQMIPLILSNVITLLITGALIAKFKHYVPFFYACTIFTSIACGLIVTWQVDSSAGVWIGYQIIEGVGTGFALQLPSVAIQAVCASTPLHLGRD